MFNRQSEKKCMLQAHRGVSTDFPENTMSAFYGAWLQGYDIIEMDPRFTADNRCIILYDRTVNRTGRCTDGAEIPEKTEISSLTFDQVCVLDFGKWFAPEYADEKIPTLEEVLLFAIDKKTQIKFDNIMQAYTEEQLNLFFDAVDCLNAQSITGFTCTSTDYMRKVATRFPNSKIHYDGFVDENSLKAIKDVLINNDLTVWLRYDNALTSWNKDPPADDEHCHLVKEYAKLGIWILSTKDELAVAVNQYQADIIETTGSIKPNMLNEI